MLTLRLRWWQPVVTEILSLFAGPGLWLGLWPKESGAGPGERFLPPSFATFPQDPEYFGVTFLTLITTLLRIGAIITSLYYHETAIPGLSHLPYVIQLAKQQSRILRKAAILGSISLAL